MPQEVAKGGMDAAVACLAPSDLDPFRSRINGFIEELRPRFVGREWLVKRVRQELAPRGQCNLAWF